MLYTQHLYWTGICLFLIPAPISQLEWPKSELIVLRVLRWDHSGTNNHDGWVRLSSRNFTGNNWVNVYDISYLTVLDFISRISCAATIVIDDKINDVPF